LVGALNLLAIWFSVSLCHTRAQKEGVTSFQCIRSIGRSYHR